MLGDHNCDVITIRSLPYISSFLFAEKLTRDTQILAKIRNKRSSVKIGFLAHVEWCGCARTDIYCARTDI